MIIRKVNWQGIQFNSSFYIVQGYGNDTILRIDNVWSKS